MTCMIKILGLIIDANGKANNERIKTIWVTIVHVRGSAY